MILKITDDGRCIVGRILHGGMMHKLGKHESSDVKLLIFCSYIICVWSLCREYCIVKLTVIEYIGRVAGIAS